MRTIYSLIIFLASITLSAQNYLEEGDIVSDLQFQTTDGKTISIEELRGKVVYINFFAFWCQPCMKELALMEDDILSDIKSDKLYFVTLGRGHTLEELQKFKIKKNYAFNIGCDTDKTLFKRFSEKGIPLNIIINRRGKIIYKKTGFSDTGMKKIKRKIKWSLL